MTILKPRGFHSKLVVSVAQAALLLMLIASAIAFAVEFERSRSEITPRMVGLLDSVEATAAVATSRNDREMGEHLLARLIRNDWVYEVRLFGKRGLDLRRTREGSGFLYGAVARELVSPDESDETVGRLTIVPKTSAIFRDAAHDFLLSVLTSISAIALTAWIVLSIVRSAVSYPLLKVSHALHSAIAGGEHRLAPVADHRHDELGHLVTDVNELLDRLHRRFEIRHTLLSFALDHAREAAYLIDESARLQYVNVEARRVLGYTDAELLGMTVHDINPDSSAECWRGHWSELKARRSLTFECWHRAKDGHRFQVEINANYLEYDGRAYGLALVRDITERKAAEKLLIHYAAIVEFSDDAIIGKDLEGVVTSWNKGAESIFGYRQEEAVGRSIRFLIPEAHWEEERMILNEIRRGYTVKHYETERRRKDGRLIDVSVTVSPLRDRQGSIVGVSKIARDITERKEVEADLRRHREKLEELVAGRTEALETANRELEAFSYSVSHDLRTPLRAIDGFSRMLANKYAGDLDQEAQRLIRVVRENTARMSQLIDDILAFSRAGRTELRLTEVDMEQSVRAAWLDLEPQRAGRDIRLDIKPLRPALGDPAMLRQVWANLLGNAVKFTRPRTVAHIEVGAFVEGPETGYYVKDDGVGFEPEYAHKLFGVFQRLHGVEEFEGTGIGLAIVKRVVSRHGGQVAAEGKVGAGATFRFTLPAEKA